MNDETNYSAKVGQKIRELREQKGMTLTLLAKRTGISKSYLSNIETGKAENPSINALKKIADALGVELTSLLDLEESTSAPSGSGDFEFPVSAGELSELTSPQPGGPPVDEKTKRTLSEISEVLTDPEVPVGALDEIEDKVLSYVKWLREKIKGPTSAETSADSSAKGEVKEMTREKRTRELDIPAAGGYKDEYWEIEMGDERVRIRRPKDPVADLEEMAKDVDMGSLEEEKESIHRAMLEEFTGDDE